MSSYWIIHTGASRREAKQAKYPEDMNKKLMKLLFNL